MNEEDMRKSLATALLYIKEQERELSELKNQVAAMRDIMKDASPNFARMFSERVESFRSQGDALNDETLKIFDNMILKLRNGWEDLTNTLLAQGFIRL
jgi:hypothetical protein